jgi:hypothetical protein
MKAMPETRWRKYTKNDHHTVPFLHIHANPNDPQHDLWHCASNDTQDNENPQLDGMEK